jgi:hypothetical protein
MQIITIIDYLLLPLYLYVFYIIIRKRSINYTDASLRKIFITAFTLRMVGSIIYSLMIQYYYGYGDSFTFYTGSNFLREQVLQDIGNISYFFAPAKDVGKWYEMTADNTYYTGYVSTESNLFVMKLAAIVSLLSFNKFLIISLFFGLFSFAGQWKLFQVFNEVNQGKNQKLMAYAVLYTPALWFWASGLMKDSVCLGAVGFIVAILYKMFIKKEKTLKDIIFLVFLIYLVYSIKSYIIIVLAVSIGTFVFARFMINIRNVVFKGILTLLFFFVAVIGAYVANLEEQLQILVEESKAQVDSYQKNYNATNTEDERTRGSVESKEIDASVTGMVLYSPTAIFTCLFRPFLWESRKVMILFTALESTLLLLCTLYLFFRTRLLGFFRIIISDEFVLFAFLMSMLFALIIGFTTYNFGTIVRYKTILLPFYYFLLVQVYSIQKNREQSKIIASY